MHPGNSMGMEGVLFSVTDKPADTQSTRVVLQER